MIKTRLRNRLEEQNLAHLMRIAIEMPETLPGDIVESVVDIWNRKTRRIAVYFALIKFHLKCSMGDTKSSRGRRMFPASPLKNLATVGLLSVKPLIKCAFWLIVITPR